MHIVESKTSIDVYGLPAGRYYADDLNAVDVMRLGNRGETTLNSVDRNFKPFDEMKDWNGRKILIVRPGGFGDLLFLTPSIAEIKKRWPLAEVSVAVFSRFADVLKTSQVDSIVTYPVSVEDAEIYDAIVFMENCVEGNPDAEKEHIVDVIAKRIGLSSLSSKEVLYGFTQEEVAWAAARYPRTEKKRVAVHLSASGHVRNWPAAMMTEFIMALAKRGIEVFLLGNPGEVNTRVPSGIRDLTAERLSFRQSVAAMSMCDMVVGPDSVMIHMAGAIHMPALGLYGPFPWKLRTAYAPTVRALQGHEGCSLAPCFYHGIVRQFPLDGPCAKSGRCEVMASIKVQRVLAATQSILDEKK